MARKLLIAFASAGSGHKRAATALQRAFEAGEHGGTAETVDVLDHMTTVFRKLYLKSYFSVISALPWYWRFLYHRWDKRSPHGLTRRAMCALDRLNARGFVRLIEEQKPTHIVCTHFLAAEIVGWMRRTGRLDAPVAVVVTDYDAHRIWMNPGTDHYFVASDYLRGLFIAKGAPPERTTTAGIPVDPVFADPMECKKARVTLDLELDLPTVLTLGGGAGIGGVKQTVAALAESDHLPEGGVQILAVAGHNQTLKAQLDALTLPAHIRLVTYGFVNNIETLMAASDLIVTKPGGMSSTECLAMGLPMVLTVPIPGQEERNSAFLVGCGAAMTASTTDEVCREVCDLLADPDRLARMRAAALRAARPRAAFDIIDTTLRL
jgi:processive 1,2-diacylglycerol beta-glucosyltransferase